MSIGVYQILNTTNGKRYIGSTTRTFAMRKGQHFYELRRNNHKNSKMQNAYNKYGENAFKFSIIEIIDNLNDIVFREDHYIKTLKPEYNIRPNAESNFGLIFTDEHRENLSNAHLGQIPWNKDCTNVYSDEMKKRMSDSHKGNTAHLGKHHSEATKEVLRAHRLGKKLPPFSDEHKAKIKESITKWWADRKSTS